MKEYLKAIKDYFKGFNIMLFCTLLLSLLQILYNNSITKYLMVVVIFVLMAISFIAENKVEKKVNSLETEE